MSREPNPSNTLAGYLLLAMILLLVMIAALNGGITYLTR